MSKTKKRSNTNLKFLLLLSAALAVFSLITLSLARESLPQKISVLSSTVENRYFEEIITVPVLVGYDSLPTLSAVSALIVDVDSQVTLFEKEPDTPLLPASTTKIVTALVSMDYYPLTKVLKVGDIRVKGQKMKLVPGEEISVRDLLYGLLIYSANDAAEVLAENYEGGREVFIEKMNIKAEKLGLKNTYFTNPSGLDGEAQLTSARDLVKVSVYAMKNPFFREAVGTREMEVSSSDGKYQHKLYNINELVGKVDGVLGVKTGWTENAMENLVTYIERDDKRLMIAVLGSRDRFGETQMLIDWIYKNYRWEKIAKNEISDSYLSKENILP